MNQDLKKDTKIAIKHKKKIYIKDKLFSKNEFIYFYQ